MISSFFLFFKKHWVVFLGLLLFVLWSGWMVSIGVDRERDDWLAAEAVRKQTEANQKTIASEGARKKEAAHATTFSVIDQAGYTKNKEIDDEKDRIINALRSDNKRLSVRIKTLPPSAACSTGPSASMGDGEARAELHEDDAGFLVGQFSRCDKIVIQLETAQQLLDADRAAVNEYR